VTISAEELVKALVKADKKVAAAESCTAGLVADSIARVPGASKVFWGSFVTYMNDAKEKMLGVGDETLARSGAVSRETAAAMARGALEKSGADYAVSVTGYAGPEGGEDGTPAGTVWIGKAAREGRADASLFRFEGGRNEVRAEAAREAINALYSLIGCAP
jgi:PncC family amidohydrolase